MSFFDRAEGTRTSLALALVQETAAPLAGQPPYSSGDHDEHVVAPEPAPVAAFLVSTAVLVHNLAATAHGRGRSPAWGGFAPLNIIWVTVLRYLPWRTAPRGFPIEPTRE